MELEKKLGKQLLIRGKRKVTLTEEGVLLRKRAEEIVDLVEKTQQEISYDLEETTGDIYIGGSISESILAAATELRNKYCGIRFHFYSGDAVDVSERLDPEVCFLPLEPKLPTQLALVWKKHAVFSNAAKEFYKSFISI